MTFVADWTYRTNSVILSSLAVLEQRLYARVVGAMKPPHTLCPRTGSYCTVTLPSDCSMAVEVCLL